MSTAPNGFALELCLPTTLFTRKIGFISHIDTADFNAENIQPQVIEIMTAVWFARAIWL